VADTLISRLFEGSAEELVAYLIDHDYLDPAALKKLSERRRGGKAAS
jgi:hypothetical protein